MPLCGRERAAIRALHMLPATVMCGSDHGIRHHCAASCPLTSAGILLQQRLHGLALQPRKVRPNRIQRCAPHARHCIVVLLARDIVAAAAKGVAQLAIPGGSGATGGGSATGGERRVCSRHLRGWFLLQVARMRTSTQGAGCMQARVCACV